MLSKFLYGFLVFVAIVLFVGLVATGSLPVPSLYSETATYLYFIVLTILVGRGYYKYWY